MQKRASDFLRPRIPPALHRNQRSLGDESLGELVRILKREYFAGQGQYLTTEQGAKDLHDHSIGRLETFRTRVIPWIDGAVTLSGAEVLEIGCGTGSSTVALAEQGARVTAIDIMEKSLAVARARCRLYNLDAEFIMSNAAHVDETLAGRSFDAVIFFAALEHMTISERMISIEKTWRMLPPGSWWCIVDTPNRLWLHDAHTSGLPFFHWLPDELALLYSRFSSRESVLGRFGKRTPDEMLAFLRTGRGVSYHEIELGTGRRASDLDVVSSLNSFLDSKSAPRKALRHLRSRAVFQSILRSEAREIDMGFFDESLDIIIRKD